MTTLVLVRHGLTHMTGPVLAGWTPGLHLDERGQAQAAAVAERLRPVPFDAIVSSPLDRCLDTAGVIAQAQQVQGRSLELQVEDRLGECRYGDWTGRPLKELAKDPLWKVVQSHPSAVVFPGPEGEPLRETQNRAVAAVRDWNARLGPNATWLACSHGDVIKAIVAGAHRMLDRLRLRPLLDGWRGEAPVDMDSLADIVVAVSRLAHERGDELAALDLNPVIATAEGAVAVDVLIVPHAPTEETL